MTKRVTKKGPRVGEVELSNVLSAFCSSRCLDDEEDLTAVVQVLLYHFRLYHKIEVK